MTDYEKGLCRTKKLWLDLSITTHCRMCKHTDETVNHIVSECSKMEKSEYKGRYNKVATAVHWGLAKKHGLVHSEQWYQQRAEKVSENDNVT